MFQGKWLILSMNSIVETQLSFLNGLQFDG